MQTKFIKTGLIMIFLALLLVSCDKATTTEMPIEKTLDYSSTPTKPAVTVTPTVKATQSLDCLPSFSSEASIEGGLLFYEYDGAEAPDKTRVWLWSKNMPTPRTILELPSNTELFLSPNGEKLVWHEFGADHFTIYDLVSKEQNDYDWKSSWQSLGGWTDNEIVSIIVNYEDIYKIGTKEEFMYFNVPRETFTSKDVSLNLPGYSQDSSVNGPVDGFAVLDPTGSFVIYTGLVDKAKKLILIKRDTGEVLWEIKAPDPSFPPPDWTASGKRAAFVIYDKRPVFYTLSQDGKASEIIGEGTPHRIVRDIKWSSDEKYIYYSYWNTIEEGPASIVNMDTKEPKEICTPGYTFMRGTWLPNDYFAYIVREGEQTDRDGLAEVRVLNTEDWTYQTLFRTHTKVGPTIGFTHQLEVLGWTPLK